MSVAWRLVAVLALLFSLAALTLEVVRIQGEGKSAVSQQEISAVIVAREESIVARLAPRVNNLRQDHDLPAMKFKSLEDLCDGMIEAIGSSGGPQNPPAARP